MSIQRGNILLFKEAHAWTEKMIVWATRGEYYHVAIALSDKLIVEATGHGISIDAAPTNPDVYTIVDISSYTTPTNIERGLSWAVAQQGKTYGWTDILFQAIKFLAPNNPFQLVRHDSWDCSDFVTRYLIEAGVPLPDQFADPYQNTPNDIARIFSILPSRKGGS